MLSQQENQPSDALKEKLRLLKIRMKKALSEHYIRLRQIAPGIGPLKDYPGDAHTDPVLLPYSFFYAEQMQLGLLSLAHTELELRVGQGHDTLIQLRRCLGVRSLLV